MTGTDGIDTDAVRAATGLFAEFAQAQSDLHEDASVSQELWLSAGLVASHYERLNELAKSLGVTVSDLLQLLLNDAKEWARKRAEAADQVYRVGPFEIDVRHNTIKIDGVMFTGVTPMEFELLLALVEEGGRSCARDWLLERVWGESTLRQGHSHGPCEPSSGQAWSTGLFAQSDSDRGGVRLQMCARGVSRGRLGDPGDVHGECDSAGREVGRIAG